VCWYHGIVSPVASLLIENRDALSCPRTLHLWPECIHLANPFKSDRGWEMGLNPSILPSHKEQIRGVDRTGQHMNAHFPFSRFWERTLLNPQHLCRLTILSKANRFHLSTLLSSVGEYL
jgi:hypothetical protein